MVRQPAPVAGNTRAAMPDGAHGIDLAKETGIGLGFGGADGIGPAVVGTNREGQSFGRRQIHHLFGIGMT